MDTTTPLTEWHTDGDLRHTEVVFLQTLPTHSTIMKRPLLILDPAIANLELVLVAQDPAEME
jgi:hypothetical protein